ncbi:MAG TPA: asparaginase [Cyclobacteriaceae bacterium]
MQVNTASPARPKGSVLVIYTGGTFGMAFDGSGTLVPFDFSRILGYLPPLKHLALELNVVSFETPIDSSNMGPDHWRTIAEVIRDEYEKNDGFVVLHGTDTMAYTASALSFMLEGLTKPVVFTGAQLPVSEPRSDARENLITAIEIASAKRDGRAIVPEVCIYFDYELLRGNRSRKVESMQFDAFDSGNYPLLAKAGVKIDYNNSAIRKAPEGPLKLHTRMDERIAILKLFPGITREAVHSVLYTPDVRGVVLETYGSGNAPTLPWLVAELGDAVARGVVVLNISQCPGGMVILGRYATSKELLRIGVIGGSDLTTEAAVTKMMILLGEYERERVVELIQKSLAGEMSV